MIRQIIMILSVFVVESSLLASSNKRKDVTSVSGAIGQLPCYVDGIDDVAMILWFKETSGTPVYSYDGRIEGEPVRHLPIRDELGLRLHFRVPSRTSLIPSSRHPALLIRNVHPTDAGWYRCRIDYRSAPTTNHIIRLNVIQPPTRLEIQAVSESGTISDQGSGSGSGSSDITYMGPYIEGQNVSIICTAIGGMPSPVVFWYRNGSLVDFTYEITGNQSVTNELIINPLNRTDSHELFTCQAWNNNETKPISHRVNIEVYSRVKHIEMEVPDQMTAGVQYNFTCRTQGAYPAVKLEFWKQQSRIGGKYQSKSDEQHIAIYTIAFTPQPSDNEVSVTCKAENPWIPQSFLETGRTLNIFCSFMTLICKHYVDEFLASSALSIEETDKYAYRPMTHGGIGDIVVYSPVAVLRYGGFKIRNFTEGESVLMECHSKSNPSLHSIKWFHQGKELLDNVSAGIHINGMTLVIRYLTHNSGGLYTCEVSNNIGKGTSNDLILELNLSPKCSSSTGTIIPLPIGQSVHLNCIVLAWPPDLNFYWTLNRSRGIVPLSSVGQIIKLNLTQYQVSLQEGDLNLDELDSKTLPTSTSNSAGAGGPFRKKSETMEIRWEKSRGSDVKFDRIFHQSQLLYKVNSNSDYTQVGCWARNSYGKQLLPCLFHIVAPIVPAEVEDNLTDSKIKEEEEDSTRSQQQEGDAVFDKLLPTLGFILTGLLIFIIMLSLSCTLFYFYVRKRRGQQQENN